MLNKWEQYRHLVEECDNYMECEVLPWLQAEESSSSSDSLEKARQQNIAKVLLFLAFDRRECVKFVTFVTTLLRITERYNIRLNNIVRDTSIG